MELSQLSAIVDTNMSSHMRNFLKGERQGMHLKVVGSSNSKASFQKEFLKRRI